MIHTFSLSQALNSVRPNEEPLRSEAKEKKIDHADEQKEEET